MGIPKYKEPAPDPAFAALQEQAKQQNIDALEARTQADTAAMMARYGTRLAFSGATSGTGGTSMTGDGNFNVTGTMSRSIMGSPLLMRAGMG